MNKYQLRIRYAGSVLVEVKAENESEAQKTAERIVQDMDSNTFLSALELQRLGTEITQLCSKCGCELHPSEQHLCNKCEDK